MVTIISLPGHPLELCVKVDFARTKPDDLAKLAFNQKMANPERDGAFMVFKCRCNCSDPKERSKAESSLKSNAERMLQTEAPIWH